MAEEKRDSRNFRLVVLGAGFSRPAGFPLANELWSEVLRRGKLLEGRAAQFTEDLDYFRRYKNECYGVEISEGDVNFEEFLSFLDIEFHLGLRGPDTWSNDGNESQVVVKTAIGSILSECIPTRSPELYLKFAGLLMPNDFVLTFNYDCLLEQALDELGTPYRLFPDRYKEVRPSGSAVVDSERDEVVILKLHGSIDWFDRSSYARRVAWFRERSASGFPNHPIFHPESGMVTACLVNGARRDDDPLKNIYRVADFKALYQRGILFVATPFLVPPSTLKFLWFDKLKDFWWGMERQGAYSRHMAIVGFSLSPHDEYARQVIYTLTKNYQNVEWDEEYFGKRKSPLILVDFRDTPEGTKEFRERYRFVNWDRARLCLDGFDESVLRQL